MNPPICNDCLKPITKGGYFWLKTEVWLSIARFEEILCLPCTEERLGRELVENDFSNQHSINYALGHLPIAEATPDMKAVCSKVWGVT